MYYNAAVSPLVQLWMCKFFKVNVVQIFYKLCTNIITHYLTVLINLRHLHYI